jgi:Tfp pilus assembly protein PilP
MATYKVYSSDVKQYSSEEEFDDGFEDYDAHLGKCKKHINNVAVASKAKAPAKAKVIQLPKIKQLTKEKKQEVTKVEPNVKNQEVTNIETKPNTHFKPIQESAREVVDDWEDLM